MARWLFRYRFSHCLIPYNELEAISPSRQQINLARCPRILRRRLLGLGLEHVLRVRHSAQHRLVSVFALVSPWAGNRGVANLSKSSDVALSQEYQVSMRDARDVIKQFWFRSLKTLVRFEWCFRWQGAVRWSTLPATWSSLFLERRLSSEILSRKQPCYGKPYQFVSEFAVHFVNVNEFAVRFDVSSSLRTGLWSWGLFRALKCKMDEYREGLLQGQLERTKLFFGKASRGRENY